MLTDGETEYLCWGLKAESVAARCQSVIRMVLKTVKLHCNVMREDCLFLERKVLENIWLESVRDHNLLGHGGQLWRCSNTIVSIRHDITGSEAKDITDQRCMSSMLLELRLWLLRPEAIRI